jgi:isoleucyl-tRNA synthetase
MSKSLGNVVAAEDIIKKMGTDGLRLWVASIDHEHDLTVSENVLQNVAEVHRKIRNTGRFLLSNLFDFNAEKDLLSSEQLLPLDYYALLRCRQLNEEVQRAYNSLDTTAVFHLLADYCAVELSSFYLDVVKDRLYVECSTGHERRSAQTVLWHILDTLTRLIAPILSFTAEHMFDHYQTNKKDSIHEKKFVSVQPLTREEQELMNRWDMLKKVRSALLKAIELEREKGIIKHPLEAQLTVFIDDTNADLAPVLSYFSSLKNRTPEALLKELMVVSQVTRVASSADLDTTMMQGVFVRVERATGSKCPRCWQWEVTQNPDGLCARCQELV